MNAVCAVGAFHNKTPAKACSCGVYAAKKENISNVPIHASLSGEIVFGEVHIWGRILEGPRGYRAQYAYPKRFFTRNKAQKEKLEALGFNVPVIIVKGRSVTQFPFQMSRRERVQHFLLRYGAGLWLLGTGVLDSQVWNMSKPLNQVLVSFLFSLG